MTSMNVLPKGGIPSKPVAKHYEFGGPLGVLGMAIGLPSIVYTGAFLINDVSGCPPPSLLHPSTFKLENFLSEIGWPGWTGLGSFRVTGWVLAYYAFNLFLYAVLPAYTVKGTILKTGGRLDYRFNAFYTGVTIMSILAIGTALQGPDFPPWTFIWENYIQIITANVYICFTLACFVYIRSFAVKEGNLENREIASEGRSGNIIYDWFMGRELNPRVDIPLIGVVDIKVFCELRPGLLGWVILDCAFMAHQYKIHGYVSDSIFLLTLFQGFYVFDSYWMEPAMLTTMDITTDGFGFMLSMGDLVWLPFLYSLQARYLGMHAVNLGLSGVSLVLAVQALGFYIFRASNNEKNRFRTDPSDPRIAHLKYMETKAGSKLLVSGWWGRARHINYLGDWIMGWSYSLPTGVAGYQIIYGEDSGLKTLVPGDARGWGMLVTYFYIIYFAAMLMHRETRDEEKCVKKYGKDWEEYKKKVPWRIVPGIY
ncbi:erg24, C-14 sterol reductase [Agyrium rufum]|nr:erg24, C-14 sterol reductase [Agyrium rufum]